MSDDKLDNLRLVRSRSNSSSFSNTGYLFLAIVFCMMCCSSFIVSPGTIQKAASQIQDNFKVNSAFGGASTRKLMSANTSKAATKQASTLASPINEDIEMTDDTSMSSVALENEEPQIGAV